jgi:hypothetical protein
MVLLAFMRLALIKMKRVIVIIIYLMVVETLNCQTITKRDFLNTEWFSFNEDSVFFKSDTVALIKYSNVFNPASGKGYKSYYESETFGDRKSVKFQFNRQKNLNFWVINYHRSSKAKIGERKWKILNNELEIYRNGLLEWTFIPISKKQIEFNYKNQVFKTIKLVMIKINN